jgi:hypothetical protein
MTRSQEIADDAQADEKPRIRAAAYSIIPDEQAVTFRIVPAPGKLLRARLIGGVIRNMATLLKATSDRPEADEDVFVTGIRMEDSGAVNIEFAVLPAERSPAGD